MIRAHTIEVDGKRLVVMSEHDYEALCRSAGRSAEEAGLPPFPKADRHGNVPAGAFARVSIARDLIRQRRAAGLSQEGLAKLAGVRQETISRIETARHTPSAGTLGKIERALAGAGKRRRRD